MPEVKTITKAPAAPIQNLPEGYAYLKPSDLQPHPLQIASKRAGMPERATIESYLDRGQLAQYAPVVSKTKDGYTILRGHLRANLATAATREELLTVGKVKDSELGLLAGLFANGLVCRVVTTPPMSAEGVRIFQDHDSGDTTVQKAMTGGEMLRLFAALQGDLLESAIAACRRDSAAKWRTIFGWISPAKAAEWGEKAAANKEEVSQRDLYLALQAVKAPMIEKAIGDKAAALVKDGADEEEAAKIAAKGKKSLEATLKAPKDAADLIIAELSRPKAAAPEAVKWKAKADEAAKITGSNAAFMVYSFAANPTIDSAAAIIKILLAAEKAAKKAQA